MSFTATETPLPGVNDSARITARSQSNFSSSFFFLPAEKREAIRRVYAFFRTVDDVVDEEPNPQRQRELLGLWRGELKRAYQGVTLVPLLKELQISIERFSIPQDYFLQLIEGCEMDLTQKTYSTFEELYEYCYRVASMVGLVCMRIFEYESPTSEQTAIDLGIALQLTNIIRDVGVDWGKGRVYLPREDLDRFSVVQADFNGARPSDNFLSLMEFQYRRADAYYAKAWPEFAQDKGHKLLAARIMAEVYRGILNKIRRKRYPVLSARVKLNLAEKTRALAKSLALTYL